MDKKDRSGGKKPNLNEMVSGEMRDRELYRELHYRTGGERTSSE